MTKFKIKWDDEREAEIEAKSYEEAEDKSLNLPKGKLVNIKNVRVEEQ
jgi:hypothetical protein